jgi:hypothetical protein
MWDVNGLGSRLKPKIWCICCFASSVRLIRSNYSSANMPAVGDEEQYINEPVTELDERKVLFSRGTL